MPDNKIPEECFAKRDSIIGCPQCRKAGKNVILTEYLQTHNIDRTVKRKFILLRVACETCGFDLASIQQPEQKFVIEMIPQPPPV